MLAAIAINLIGPLTAVAETRGASPLGSPAPPMASGTVLCAASGIEGRPVTLHFGPSDRHAIVGRVAPGTCGLRLVGKCLGGWCEVEADGRKGWADTRLILVQDQGGTLPGPMSQATVGDTGIPTRDAKVADTAPAKPASPIPSVSLNTAVIVQAPREAGHTVPALAIEPSAPRPSEKVAAVEADGEDAGPASGKLSAPLAKVGRSRKAERSKSTLRPAERAFERHARAVGRADLRCVAHVELWDTLRVRTGPGVSHRAISGIPPYACGVQRFSGCRGTWCPVRFRGVAGWVNTMYLR